MRKKILIGLISFITILLIAIIALPFLFKDQIATMVKTELNKSLNAKINVGNIDLSIIKNIRNFPNITLNIEDLQIIGKDQFYRDTLISLKSLDLALNIMSVIKQENPMKIASIRLDKANIHAIVDRQGKSNWDISKAKDAKSESSPFSLSLKSLILKDANIKYSDYTSNLFIVLNGLNHDANADFTQDIFDYSHKTNIKAVSFSQNNMSYLSKAIVQYDGVLKIEQKENKYTIKENIIHLNELGLLVNGWLKNQADGNMHMDITFKADKSEFKSIISMIPAIYSKDFKDIKTSGSFNLQGSVKGLYKKDWYPNFNITLDVMDGKFQYPSLPVAVSKVNIKSTITNPGGSLDKTVVQMPSISMMLGDEPITGKMQLKTPISNPNIELQAKGKLNLGNVSKFYPLTPGTKITGLTNIDLELKSTQSDLQMKRFENITALGYLQMFGFIYESKDMPKPIQISQFEMKFSPSYVDITQCKTKIGKSDFDLTGRLDNLVGYVLAKNEVLTGNINMKSNYIDANEFLADSNASKNAASMQTSDDYFKVPANIDISGVASINKLKYDELNITEISGTINVKNETAILNATKANLLGGNIQINGVYATKNGDKPTGSLSYNITSFDMRQVFAEVTSVKKLAPILQYIQGEFSSDMDIVTKINPDMSPDLNSMTGTAKFSIPNATISNLPLLEKIAALTKLSQLSNLQLNNTVLNMKIDKGRVNVTPFNFKAGNTNMVVSGSQGIDQSIDYKLSIDVPWSELGAATGAVDKLLQSSPIAGFANNLKPEIIRLNLLIGGSFKNPSVKMGKPEALKGDGTSNSNTVKDAAKEQINQLQDQAKEAVQNAIDSAKRQAEQKAEEVKKEAQQKVEQKVEEQKTKVIDQLKKKLPW